MTEPKTYMIHNPIGAVYISTIDEPPNAYGTWEKFYAERLGGIGLYYFRRIA